MGNNVKRHLLVCLALAGFSSSVFAGTDNGFVVTDIRLEGLQRVSPGSVFQVLPIRVNDTMTSAAARDGIKALFATGYFENIEFGRDGDVLVVKVEERPSISEINIEGNKALQTDVLMEGLKTAGLSEGQIFERSTLEGIRLELQRQYVAQGRYDAEIDAEVEALPRNRVAVNIEIDEGSVAEIRHVNIVGNKGFETDELLGQFELQSTGMWSWIVGDDKYSKEKLRGDMEKLESHYRNQGYVKFNIDSTQVAISPERDSVYITLNVTEGEKYKIDKVELAGDIVLPEWQVRMLLLVRKGQYYSQQLITSTEELITKRLGNDGYMFAKVRGIPEINEQDKTVSIKFYVDPGKRTYVRRINFKGNTNSVDEVLRREMRQLEGAPAAGYKLEQSRTRLERLGFFKEVKFETAQVPGHEDLVDVDFAVEEQHSGSIGASIGYSEGSGVLLGASLQQNNFLGTGRQVGVSAQASDYQTLYRINYVNPYYTEDGVSRGFSVFYKSTDTDKVAIARYNTDTWGANVNFGYPITETERLAFAFGFSHTEVSAGYYVVKEILATPVISDTIDSYAEYDSAAGEYLDRVRYDSDGDGVLEQGDDLNDNGIADFYEDGSGGLKSAYDTDGDGDIDFYTDFDENNDEVVDAQFDLDNNGVVDAAFDPDGDGKLTSGDALAPGAKPISGLTDDPFVSTAPGFLDKYGDTFDNYSITTSWIQNRLNRGVFATDGYKQTVAFEVTIPASDLEFYKLTYRGEKYFPLSSRYALRFHSELGIGDGYGNTDELPFYENFYSGGYGSIRGYEANTLGPRSTNGEYYRTTSVVNADGELEAAYILRDGSFATASTLGGNPDPFGGDLQVEGGIELVFPLPFITDQRSVRTVAFWDVGNVFDTKCGSTQVNCSSFEATELRQSLGVSLTWITAMGPLTFSLAKPLDDGRYDEGKVFQFSLGTGF